MFTETGFNSCNFLNFTPKQAFKELTDNNAILLDVRIKAYVAFKKFDVPETLFIPLNELVDKFILLPKDRPIIVADSAGLYSREAMQFLITKGFVNVANLAGGLVEWVKDKLPAKEDINERLSGSCMCQLRPRNKSINKRK